ncbi:MAG: putative spermidine/putrescine transport system permease protein [Rhodospirillaceae bacterium]|nr:putative spermidine/putrescine transport system permease protein [Rhodospirillaceae bacterium]
MRAGSSASMAAHAAGCAVLAFLLLPILVVVPASFNELSFIKIPPDSYSARWYYAFFADAGWFRSVVNSAKVALLATTFSLAVGTMTALALDRLAPRLRTVVTGLVISPLIVPVIMISIALYYVSRRVGLYGTVPGLALGHSLLCLPFVVINVGVSLGRLDPNLLRAATGLGAGPWHAFRTVTLPAILPGLAGGAAFAFVTSFDEVIISIFIAGYGAKTLPVKLWEEIKVEFTPVVAAGSTIILLLTVVLFFAVQLVRARAIRRSSLAGKP